VVAFSGQNPHAETWQMARMVYHAEDHVGGALIAFCDTVLGCGIGEALRDGMGRGMYERSRIPCVLRSSFAAV
jgi:hypothetical protein